MTNVNVTRTLITKIPEIHSIMSLTLWTESKQLQKTNHIEEEEEHFKTIQWLWSHFHISNNKGKNMKKKQTNSIHHSSPGYWGSCHEEFLLNFPRNFLNKDQFCLWLVLCMFSQCASWCCYPSPMVLTPAPNVFPWGSICDCNWYISQWGFTFYYSKLNPLKTALFVNFWKESTREEKAANIVKYYYW